MSTYLPAHKYENVTIENLWSQLTSPLVMWERWMMSLERPQYPGAEAKSNYLDREGFKTGGNWCGWNNAGEFPYRGRSEVPTWELQRGLWRRPLSPTQLKLMEGGRTNYATEADAMVDFFWTPAGAWKGYKEDENVGLLTLSFF